MKRVGIVCDNYKLEKFKEKLNEKGFTNYTITSYQQKTSLISVVVRNKNVLQVYNICKQVEAHFKIMKN